MGLHEVGTCSAGGDERRNDARYVGAARHYRQTNAMTIAGCTAATNPSSSRVRLILPLGSGHVSIGGGLDLPITAIDKLFPLGSHTTS